VTFSPGCSVASVTCSAPPNRKSVLNNTRPGART
jgi:hypothetical protein